MSEEPPHPIEAMVERVRQAGLPAEADMLSTVYWAWFRTVSAYRHALPYVNDPGAQGIAHAEGMLNVVTYTINYWGPQIPETPAIDNDAVRREDAADEAWHRAEDRRMRRDAGEDII